MSEGTFLDFIAADMLAHPQSIRPLDERRLQEIATLVEGMTVDDREGLPEGLLDIFHRVAPPKLDRS